MPQRPNPLRLLLLTLVAALFSATGFAEESTNEDNGMRNVILIIGDGMDEQQITIARNYLQGARGELLLDKMPLRAAVQILTVENKVNGKPVYVADSANTATSMATGQVTSRGRISTSAGSDKALSTIVEQATSSGFRAGLVTTASVTDATPAAFAAHINFRLCENPDAMVEVSYSDILLGDCSQHLKAQGGKGSIAEQLAESSLHVILGGGSKHFEPTVENGENGENGEISVAELARKNGFTVVTSPAELQQATSGQRLLGTFAPSTLPVRLQGEGGREAEEPDASLLNSLHPYLGEVTLPAPMRCEENAAHADVPSLKTMTDTALAHLSENNERGFFLMIESASIDKQSHERKPCGSIGELEQLEEALASAQSFAETHPNTLILVTADHSQAAQLIPFESLFAAYPIPTFTPGKLARVITPEGSHMAVNYATTNFMMEEHTGAAVPLFTNPEGIGRVPPYLRQPEIFNIMLEYLGL
jgi:alkaline phosphatase